MQLFGTVTEQCCMMVRKSGDFFVAIEIINLVREAEDKGVACYIAWRQLDSKNNLSIVSSPRAVYTA